MLKSVLTAIFGVLLLNSASVLACPGGVYSVNDDTRLFGDSIYDVSDKRHVPIADLRLNDAFDVTDSRGKATHSVTILWVEKDDQGVFHTIYQVRDLAAKKAKTIKVTTNYAGGGMVSRSLPPYFQVDETYGCGSRE